jgi:hypothetical protein
VDDGLEGGEKANCLVGLNSVENGKLVGGLFLEPVGIAKDDNLSRQRSESGTEVARN